jgi:hypothetical protein
VLIKLYDKNKVKYTIEQSVAIPVYQDFSLADDNYYAFELINSVNVPLTINLVNFKDHKSGLNITSPVQMRISQQIPEYRLPKRIEKGEACKVIFPMSKVNDSIAKLYPHGGEINISVSFNAENAIWYILQRQK